MILLDENVSEDQCQLLRGWRIRFRQIGQGVGRQGMKDEEQILPLLHELNGPTFLTRDLGFFDEDRRHAKYALICLAVSQKEAALFIKRVLAAPVFQHQGQATGQSRLRQPHRITGLAFARQRRRAGGMARLRSRLESPIIALPEWTFYWWRGWVEPPGIAALILGLGQNALPLRQS